jgi:Uri superfamily endonuclease
MSKGIYCLVFQNPAMELAVGRLGKLTLCEGWHIYVGSALGSGGLKRARRHIRLYQTKEGNARWHVDSLLLSPLVTLSGIVYALTDLPYECRLAQALDGASVRGFGCSDCRCSSHLLYRPSDPVEEILAVMGALGLEGINKTIKSIRIEH